MATQGEIVGMFMFFSVIVTLVVSISTAIIAKKKGRSGLIWFILGVFFNIIALIIALLIPYAPKTFQSDNYGRRDARRMEPEPGESEAVKKCPFCAETIKLDAVVCRYCGRELVKKGNGQPVIEAKKTVVKKAVASTKASGLNLDDLVPDLGKSVGNRRYQD